MDGNTQCENTGVVVRLVSGHWCASQLLYGLIGHCFCSVCLFHPYICVTWLSVVGVAASVAAVVAIVGVSERSSADIVFACV